MSWNHCVWEVSERPPRRGDSGFTLIELLVVIGIITLLVGLLMPALSGSRKQAKSVACLARLKDMGTAVASYASSNFDVLPPMMIDWDPAQLPDHDVAPDAFLFEAGYGWAELLFADMIPSAQVNDRVNFPAQRNYQDKYARVFNCPEGVVEASHSGHYRAYEPGWGRETMGVNCAKAAIVVADRLKTPTHSSRLNPNLPLIGDATENSTRGNDIRSGSGHDGLVLLQGDKYSGSCAEPDSSFIGLRSEACPPCCPQPRLFDSYVQVFNEANMVHPEGCVPNKFCHRHRGDANYLFGDTHAENSRTLRQELGCDWDRNGVHDAANANMARLSGCPHPMMMGPGD